MKGKLTKKEMQEIDKEIQFKKDIMEKVNPLSLDNFDKNSIIFSIFNINSLAHKKKLISFIAGTNESIFHKTFNVLVEYFENKIKKEYIKIEDIVLTKNLFGIIEDRIKSNEEMIKETKKELIKIEKDLIKIKDYDKMSNLKSTIFWRKNSIEDYEKEIRFLQGMKQQLKSDIRSLRNKK